MRHGVLRDVLHGALALLAAFLVHAALRRVPVPYVLALDAYSVAVIAFALVKGEVAGAVLGAVCGLVIDAFSLGVFGLAGLAATVTGYATGYVSRKINVLAPVRTFVFAGLAGALDFGLWVLLSAVFFGRAVPWGGGLAAARPLTTAAAVTAILVVYRRIKARCDG